ncbi:MAG: glycosyltransferase family 39 protein [Candidatus Margulisiibacteriota bacterium]
MKNIHKLFNGRFNIGSMFSAIGLFLFFILLRWNTVNIPFIRDEGAAAYNAWLLLQNIPIYLKSFCQTPPVFYYTYMLACLINPDAFWAPRVVAYIFVGLATILLGFIARKEFGKGAGWIAMWIVTPLILLPGIITYEAKQEKFLLLPLMGILFGHIYWNKNSSSKHWFIAGLLSAITLSYKPTVCPIILFIFIVQIIETWKSAPALKQILKKIACAIFGGGLALLIMFAFFIAHHSLAAFWECVVTYNRHYTEYSGFGLSEFFRHLKIFWANWWILFLLTAYYLIRRPLRWWFYTGLFAAALLSTAGSLYNQYYVPLMPIWALVITGAITSLANDISSKYKLPARYLRMGLLIIVLLLLILPSWQTIMMSPLEFQLRNYRGPTQLGGNPFYGSPIVAKRVQELTSPDDYVYIAGSEAQILYYAKRQSPTRFTISYPLMHTPMALEYQKEVIRDLEKNPPEIIVFAPSNLSWMRRKDSPVLIFGYLDQLQSKKDYRVIGGFVQGEHGGFLQEPVNAGAFHPSRYSLLIMKRVEEK